MQKGFSAVVLLVVLMVAAVAGYLVFKNQGLIPTLPTNPNPSPTIQDETTNWKTYTNFKLGISFKYPAEWYIERETDDYLRIQNYNPSGAPGRGYDPNEDQGKFAIQIRRFEEDAKTIDQLKTLVLTLDKQQEIEFGKKFLRNEKEITRNNYFGIYRETSRTKNFDIYTPDIYLLDGKSKVINVVGALDISAGKISLDQILSTFKFTDNQDSQAGSLKNIPVLSTKDWKTISLNGVSMKVPQEAIVENGTYSRLNIEASAVYIRWDSSDVIPTRVTIEQYKGGSRREQFLEGITRDAFLRDCKPIFEEALFGNVKALQIAISTDCQGGGGAIATVVGNKFVLVHDLYYGIDALKQIQRFDKVDALVSTLKVE